MKKNTCVNAEQRSLLNDAFINICDMVNDAVPSVRSKVCVYDQECNGKTLFHSFTLLSSFNITKFLFLNLRHVE